MKLNIIIVTLMSVVAGQLEQQADAQPEQADLQVESKGYNNGCPPKEAKCSYNYRTFTPVDKEAPPCWNLSYGRWNCSPKVYNKCPSGKKDIKDCPYPKPEPECPKPDDTCQSNYRTFKASDPNAPACWVKRNYRWECKNPAYGKSCDASNGEANVKECVKPPKQKCPTFGNICKDSSGRIYSFAQKDTPKCWKKSGYNLYSCRNPPYDGNCTSDEINVKQCPIAGILEV